MLTGADGVVFKGMFQGGLERGKGCLVLPQGGKLEGEWRRLEEEGELRVERGVYLPRGDLGADSKWGQVVGGGTWEYGDRRKDRLWKKELGDGLRKGKGAVALLKLLSDKGHPWGKMAGDFEQHLQVGILETLDPKS
jgi:hypothetical protein